MNKKKEKLLKEKSKNKNSIRVLYKQVGKSPRVRIIPNVQILKKAIISRKLDIIPYQNVFIICNNQDYMKTEPINVVFDFFHISGDLIVLQINSEKREFESLSQEDIIWFTQDLINKSFNTNKPKVKNYTPKKPLALCERDYDYISNNKLDNFEEELIKVLVNIELVLASLLRNGNLKNE